MKKKSYMFTLKIITLAFIILLSVGFCTYYFINKGRDTKIPASGQVKVEIAQEDIIPDDYKEISLTRYDVAQNVDGSFGLQLDSKHGFKTDSSEDGNVSEIIFYVNDRKMGPAHTNHSDIMNLPGSFSHWQDYLLFSLPPEIATMEDIESIVIYGPQNQ